MCYHGLYEEILKRLGHDIFPANVKRNNFISTKLKISLNA